LFAAAPVGLTGSSGSATDAVRLKAVTSRVNAQGASLVIEATEPVPYVTTRPDAFTVLLEFRNVTSEGVLKSVTRDPKGPIADVAIESLPAAGSRVRVSLAEPMTHQVRSERNTVVVDFQRTTAPVPVSVVSSPSVGKTPIQGVIRIQTADVDPLAALGLLPPASSPATGKADRPSTPPPAPPSTPPPARATSPTQTMSVKLASPPSVAESLKALSQPPPGAQAQAAAPPASIQLGAGQGGNRTYTGHPVSLDFQGADLRAVLRTFSEISGLNIVIDPAVQGSVDVVLTDVPWDQALDLILRANKLGYIVDGTVVRIAPLSVLADEEAQRRKLADEQALAGELRVLTKTLSYARAEELQGLLTRSALSQRGTVQVDARTNTLIITDLADRLTTANDLIGTLDRAQPQVEIEARIVQTTKNFARALGIQWGFSGRVDPALGNTTPLAFPNNGSLAGRVGPTQGPGNQPTAVDLGVGAAQSAVGLALGSVNGAFNLDVALSALETSGNGRILSTPRVSTLNNVEAEVTQGVQIPLQTIANNTVTVTFKDAALTLKVTPQITAADTVIMKVTLENATPDFSRAAGPAAIPPIDTQRAITTLLVNDGQTTVIGGIYTSNQQNLSDRTPGLASIPLISWLFKRDRVSDESRELLIFITPRIIKG
jgi:type IV pilus assembly protein PilQ